MGSLESTGPGDLCASSRAPWLSSVSWSMWLLWKCTVKVCSITILEEWGCLDVEGTGDVLMQPQATLSTWCSPRLGGDDAHSRSRTVSCLWQLQIPWQCGMGSKDSLSTLWEGWNLHRGNHNKDHNKDLDHWQEWKEGSYSLRFLVLKTRNISGTSFAKMSWLSLHCTIIWGHNLFNSIQWTEKRESLKTVCIDYTNCLLVEPALFQVGLSTIIWIYCWLIHFHLYFIKCKYSLLFL